MARARGWSPLAGSLLDRARALSREEFCRELKDKYLLVPHATGTRDAMRVTTKVMRSDPKERERADALPFDVVPIRKSATNQGSLITIGRGDTNDIVLGSTEVSKIHALFMIHPSTGQVTITDAGSTNGTKVLGKALEPRVQAEPLHGGEELMIGTVRVVFHVPGSLWDFLRTVSTTPP